MFDEFRTFILRGNVIDLAVAFIMGAAFNSIVDSMVNDIIMPPIGLLLGGMDFGNLFLALDGKEYASLATAQAAGAATINYGLFINALLSFLIVSVVMFLLCAHLITPAPRMHWLLHQRMRHPLPKPCSPKSEIFLRHRLAQPTTLPASAPAPCQHRCRFRVAAHLRPTPAAVCRDVDRFGAGDTAPPAQCRSRVQA